METAVKSTKTNLVRAPQECVPVVGLASAVAFAAAGSLLGISLLARKRRLPIPGQLCLGALAGCAAAVTWMKRKEEMEAARHLVRHVHVVRDARWLKKHPVAYG